MARAPSAFCYVPPECQIHDLFSHKCAQLTQFRYQSNILADTDTRASKYIFVYFALHAVSSLNDICNGLLRVCAYVARRNALDNCYYLKLHLPPPFFYKFCDKYPNGGIALCELECVPPTDDFFMQKYATDHAEKYDSSDRAHRQALQALMQNRIK